MRFSVFVLPILLLLLVGCGSKGSSDSSSTTSAATGVAGLRKNIVGEWTVGSTHGSSKVDGTLSIREDGTFTNAGTVASVKLGKDSTVKMTLSYSVDGKWTIDGSTVSTTPNSVKAHVDSLEITTKDPSNQAAVNAEKGEVEKNAEKQAKVSLNVPSKARVESATGEELTLVGANNAKVVYKRKK